MDIIISILLIAAISGAIIYIVKEKKKGKKCIGCPYAGSCGSQNKCTCNDPKKENENG